VASTATKIKERRLERMRLGQAVCDYVTLPSEDQVRLCIVPLTEAQYRQVLQKVAELEATDNIAGMAIRDRTQCQEILVRAIREESDLTQRVYDDVDEMMEDLNQVDVDELYDRYQEMTESASPSIEGIPPEELENLKKRLQVMDWNALSGRAWYAAKRFLSEIMPTPLLDNSPGSGSTNSLTTTSE
jgi:cell division protein FtsI/penicillin-binding protein 2